MPERALLIWNPVAGRHPSRVPVEAVAAELRGGGWQAEITETCALGGARPAAERGLAKGFTVFVACGGDGTLRETAQAIATAPGRPALSAVPLGTANLMAHAMGWPRSPVAAARSMLGARRQTRLLGQAIRPSGVDYFLSVASVGFDAEVVHRLAPGQKLRWGKLAYVACAARLWRTFRPPTLQCDSGSVEGLIMGLTGFYGGRLRLGGMRPGEPILLALRASRALLLAQGLALATVGLERAPGVERVEAEAIEIHTPLAPLELDGDACGLTPVRLALAPGGIEMLSGYNSGK